MYSNAAVLVDRQGAIAGIYRKVHPVAMLGHDDLENGITPGCDFPVFDCDFGKLGIQICWDIVFDDGWQALADKGAEIVVWPTRSPATALARCSSGPASLLHRVELLAKQRDSSTNLQGWLPPKSKRPTKCWFSEVRPELRGAGLVVAASRRQGTLGQVRRALLISLRAREDLGYVLVQRSATRPSVQ